MQIIFQEAKEMDETIRALVTEATSEQVFAVWFLIGAALVFWMQAGFAMVEAGFTRAKNTGNIIMKNLMDFCIGTVVFILIGFGLLMGEDLVGLIGKPGFDLFTTYSDFNFSSFVFNLIFCATAATIVSGAMAERTPTASIPELSRRSYIRSRHTGYGVADGSRASVFTILPAPAQFTWSAEYRRLSALSCSDRV